MKTEPDAGSQTESAMPFRIMKKDELNLKRPKSNWDDGASKNRYFEVAIEKIFRSDIAFKEKRKSVKVQRNDPMKRTRIQMRNSESSSSNQNSKDCGSLKVINPK